MEVTKRIAVSAAKALAGAIVTAITLPWVARARRKLRKWRNAA